MQPICISIAWVLVAQPSGPPYRVDPARLAAADTVLRAVFSGDSVLREAAAAISPPR